MRISADPDEAAEIADMLNDEGLEYADFYGENENGDVVFTIMIADVWAQGLFIYE